MVKAQVFLTDLNDFDAFDEVWKQYFKVPPARSTIGTTDLLVVDAIVEIDLIGYVPGNGMTCEAIKSGISAPLAHYTEAWKVGGMVFAAGQLPTDFKTGIPPEARTDPAFPYYGSDIKKRTHYILDNLKKTFEAAGSSLDHVVKAQVFLTDLNDFNAFDEVWKQYLQGATGAFHHRHHRAAGQGRHDRGRSHRLRSGDGMTCEAINSGIPAPLAHYTEAWKVGGLVFAAGQLPTDFKTGIPPEARTDPAFPYYGSDIKKRTHYILDNLKKTFEAAGSSLDHVIKAQVFLTDLNDFNAFDEVWKQYFKVPPARSTVGTTGLLVKDAMIEVDLIGVAGS